MSKSNKKDLTPVTQGDCYKSKIPKHNNAIVIVHGMAKDLISKEIIVIFSKLNTSNVNTLPLYKFREMFDYAPLKK